MIKEMLEWINTKRYEIQEIEGSIYHVSAAGVKKITRPTTTFFSVCSLTGLIDYINSNIDKFATEKLMLQVVNEKSVLLMSALSDGVRDEYIIANANVPPIPFGNFIDPEKFNVMLQSCFEKTDDLDKILALVGTIKEENVRTTGDDGISQRVVAKTGIARVEEVDVPNPVTLVPFRTFVEVPQPASKFIFRMQDGPKAALFEADAGAWKMQAMAGIKKFLKENIKNENINILA
jgi:hypothetical protein